VLNFQLRPSAPYVFTAPSFKYRTTNIPVYLLPPSPFSFSAFCFL